MLKMYIMWCMTQEILRSKISRSHTDTNIKMPPIGNTQHTLTKSCSCANLQRLAKKWHSERLTKTYSEESLIESLSNIDKIRKKFDDQKKFGYLFTKNISKEPIGKTKNNKKIEIVRGQPVSKFELDHSPNMEENISENAVALKEKNQGQVKSLKPNDLKKQSSAREVKAIKDDNILIKNKSLNKKHVQPKLKFDMGAIFKEQRIEKKYLKATNAENRTKYKNRLKPSTTVEKPAKKDISAKNKTDKKLNQELVGKSKINETVQQNYVHTSYKEDQTKNKNKWKLNTENGQSPADANHERVKPSVYKSETMRKKDASKAENKIQKPNKEGPTFDSENKDINQTNKIFERRKHHLSPRKQKEVVSVEIGDVKCATQFKNKNGEQLKKVIPKIVTPKKDTEQFQKTGTLISLKNRIDGKKEIHKSNTKGKLISETLQKEHLAKQKQQDPFGVQLKAKSNENNLQPEMLSSGKKIGGRNKLTNSLTNVSQGTCFRKNIFSNSDENDMKRLREFLKKELKNINKKMVLPLVVKMPIVVKHVNHKTIVPNCIICADLDVNLNLEELMNKKSIGPEEYEYIKGERVFKAKAPRKVLTSADVELDSPNEKPTLFKSFYSIQNEDKSESEHTKDNKNTTLNAKGMVGVGVIKYSLSDRQFIEKGWTVLPVEKVVSKEFTFGMRPAHPEFDWFKYNKNKGYMQYDTGEKLADFDDKGRGRWFYKNGRIALDYYDSEELNGNQRIVIYSSGELDRSGRSYPITILATFDYAGNGIVFDHSGKIRLKYNQKTGVILDRQIGPVSRWKWHSLTDPLELKRVMTDTHLNDPEIMKLGGKQGIEIDKEKKRKTEDTDMLAVEIDNYMKEKNKLLEHELRPYQIKTKAFKINEQFSLRIMDQANIHIIFRDHLKQLKLNIGMILDNQDIKDIEIFDVGQVLNTIEQYPAKSGSIEEIQNVLANARRCELAYTERKRLLVPALLDGVNAPAGSESLTSSLWPPPQTETSLFSSDNYNKSKKSLTKNMYYNTRFI